MNIYRKTTISNVVNFINEEIKLSGWISSKRDHGSLIFLELRDSSGTIQLVLDSHVLKDPISLESVVSIDGLVQKRSPENINSQNPLGYLEVQVKTLKVLSYCSNLPFLPEVAHTVNDELQLKYRYIALRNSQCLNKVLMKSKISTYMREFMNSQEFQEISTPIITASSPEGARDFLVPSRLHPGKFYALPQAPQIYKQLLMVSGINRYFQVAPCFRDEDARADRNYGEFHQLDFEMSFATADDVLNLLEKLMNYVLGKVCTKPIKFTRITYDESLKTYGSDKPNLNNPLKLEDFTEIFANSSMDLFKNKILRENAVIKGVRIKEPCDGEKVLQFTQERGFRAAYISKHNNVLKGPISKFLPENIVENGETIFFVCDELYEACEKTGIIIKYFEKKFNEINHIVFVTDFPMFEKTDDGSFTFKHNPFSMPQCDKIDENNLDKIYAHQYDMVLNGYELASGSMRNHKIDLLSHCLKICKMNSDHILTRAFQHGVPPHAGAAIGIDRLAMLLTNSQNTREVNAFPMSTNGTDNLMNSPSVIDKKTLDELYIAIKS